MVLSALGEPARTDPRPSLPTSPRQRQKCQVHLLYRSNCADYIPGKHPPVFNFCHLRLIRGWLQSGTIDGWGDDGSGYDRAPSFFPNLPKSGYDKIWCTAMLHMASLLMGPWLDGVLLTLWTRNPRI
jgi:hypothetical protein